MPLREPAWWYAADPSLTARALAPAAAIYGAVARRRLERPPAHRSAHPVVCIGNFTAGGTGKTPLALFLAAALKRIGRSPVILTRGYGAAARDPTLVDVSRHTARDVGDEALLLARTTPVMVAPDRAAGAQAIASEVPSADVVLMDDGLQNPALAKDLVIAVVDGRRALGNGRIIPAGPLRAPLGAQLRCTDVVVVNGTAAEREALSERLAAERFKGPVLCAAAEPCGDVAWLPGRRVLAYAGIGHPQRFYGLVDRLGGERIQTRSFPDHHAFSDGDASALLAEAAALDATLVTTEKDYVRLAGAEGAVGALRHASRTVPVALAFAEGDADLLIARVLAVLSQRPRQGPDVRPHASGFVSR